MYNFSKASKILFSKLDKKIDKNTKLSLKYAELKVDLIRELELYFRHINDIVNSDLKFKETILNDLREHYNNLFFGVTKSNPNILEFGLLKNKKIRKFYKNELLSYIYSIVDTKFKRSLIEIKNKSVKKEFSIGDKVYFIGREVETETLISCGVITKITKDFINIKYFYCENILYLKLRKNSSYKLFHDLKSCFNQLKENLYSDIYELTEKDIKELLSK